MRGFAGFVEDVSGTSLLQVHGGRSSPEPVLNSQDFTQPPRKLWTSASRTVAVLSWQDPPHLQASSLYRPTAYHDADVDASTSESLLETPEAIILPCLLTLANNHRAFRFVGLGLGVLISTFWIVLGCLFFVSGFENWCPSCTHKQLFWYGMAWICSGCIGLVNLRFGVQ